MICMYDHNFVTDEQDNLSFILECKSDFVPLMAFFRYLRWMLKCTDERQNGYIYKKSNNVSHLQKLINDQTPHKKNCVCIMVKFSKNNIFSQ